MVYHVLKDGSRPTSIRGHIVKMTDAKNTYEILSRIKRRKNTPNLIGGSEHGKV